MEKFIIRYIFPKHGVDYEETIESGHHEKFMQHLQRELKSHFGDVDYKTEYYMDIKTAEYFNEDGSIIVIQIK